MVEVRNLDVETSCKLVTWRKESTRLKEWTKLKKKRLRDRGRCEGY